MEKGGHAQWVKYPRYTELAYECQKGLGGWETSDDYNYLIYPPEIGMKESFFSWRHASGMVVAGLLLVGCNTGPGLGPISSSNMEDDVGGGDTPHSVEVGDAAGSGRIDTPQSESAVDVAAPSLQQHRYADAFLKSVDKPDCDAGNPEVLIIGDDSDWAKINDPEYRVFCVRPGDYRGVGAIVLERSGKAEAPRILLLDSDSNAHPADLPESGQALIESLEFKGADFWYVERLSIVDTPDRQSVVRFGSGASDNTIDRMRIEHFYEGITLDDGAHRNTIQNSLIGDQDFHRGGDAVCIALQGFRTRPKTVRILDTKILNNEIYDCNDGIQTVVNPKASYVADFSGLLIAGNDIYLTSARYSNCSGKMDPNGACACAENAIDLKGGAEDVSKPVMVVENSLRGWRKTDQACGGSGSWGSALVGHFRLKNAELIDNIISDSARGISIGGAARSMTIRGNLLHGINSKGSNEGIAFAATGNARDVDFSENTVVDATAWITLNRSRAIVECNVIIDSGRGGGRPGSGTVVARNSYYATPAWASDSSGISFGAAADSRNEERCFDIRPLSGKQRLCLEYGQTTDQSPHHPCATGS